jgi:predicted esterase
VNNPTRRLIVAAPMAALLPGCGRADAAKAEKAATAVEGARDAGRLQPTAEFVAESAPGPGAHMIGGGARRTQIYIPKSPAPATGYPLALVLHGATQSAEFVPATFAAAAEQFGVVLAAPNSAAVTWDLSGGPRGVDAATIQAALDGALARAPIDSARIACAGFSDGASYALSLGLTQGTVFSDILAFSPGYVKSGELKGRPRIFISHGISDRVLPFGNARRIARSLERKGYDVRFFPFRGGHWPVPAAIDAGFRRFLNLP